MQARLSTNFAPPTNTRLGAFASLTSAGARPAKTFNVTDAVCAAALHKLRTEESKGTKEALAIVNANEWVTQC